MRFNLQEVKKSVQRRGGRDGQLAVSLHFLQPGELHDEITRLVAYHESMLGLPHHRFSLDDARSYIGDYRLAHCLITTLSYWYSWRQREWAQAVRECDGSEDLLALASPIPLRLALYDYINAQCGGFVTEQSRAEHLEAFGRDYALTAPDLDYLLALDSDEEALLTRSADAPPRAAEVAALYNQWVFEAALFNASSVNLVIDCVAFSAIMQGTGVGAVIKRLCFLARKLGVYYDLSYEDDALLSARAGVAPKDTLITQDVRLLHLTLYGPQEVTGTPQQYGLRLARLCRLLLGYTQGAKKASRSRSSFAGAVLSAQARLHFLQRTYTFAMDEQLLRLLPLDEGVTGNVSPAATDTIQTTGTTILFDSSIERAFSEAFAALARSQGTDGWSLEREPEPLLLSSTLFIPDFALSRGQQRIYVEILGFWTPSYRERKIQKLRELQGRTDLLLAIPVEAKEAFNSVVAHFPVVYYDGQLSVAEVLRILRSRYDDFAQRQLAMNVEEVRASVLQEGLLDEQRCYDVLHCYRRSELQTAVRSIVDAMIQYWPGLGLYSQDWLQEVQRSLLPWLSARGSLSLGEVIQELVQCWPLLARCDSAAIEALLVLMPGLRIRRDSIFDAVVEVSSTQDAVAPEVDETPSTQPVETVKIARKRVREKGASLKKRVSQEESVQENLWG